jgi:hypothetical protein
MAPPPKLPVANQTYQVYPSFQGYTGNPSDSCTTPQVYLMPPSFTVEKASVVQLSELFSGGEEQLSKTCGNSVFSLKFTNTGGKPVKPAAVRTEVTAGPSIWACNPTARAELRAKFAEFLQQVEGLEGSALLPSAARRIALALADVLPAPLAETLFFRYGMNPEAKTAPYVDVAPGMRLRIQAEASQFLSPGSPNNLYLPAGELCAEVGAAATGQGSGRIVSFDPFLQAIRAPSVEGPSTSPTQAGGLVDLAPVGGARSHWRLFVPRNISSPRGPGKLTVEGNFTLVGANSLAAIEAATASYPKAPTSGETPLYLIFPGRALLVPEIPVWVTLRTLTTSEYVPLGTTLANVAERYSMLPLSPANLSEVVLTRPTTARSEGKAKLSIYTETEESTVEPRLFEVPLIAGDSVTLNPAGW